MRSTHALVTVPPTSIDLCTLDICKDELDITDTDSDYLLTRWISESSARIAAYCNRPLALQTLVETFNLSSYMATMSPALALKSYPIQSIAITENGDVLDPASYQFDDYGLVRRQIYGNRWNWFGCCIEVTYSGGYSLPDGVPLDLRSACLSLMKYRLASRSRDPSLRAVTIPGVIEKQFWVGDTSSGLPPEVAECCDPYREYDF